MDNTNIQTALALTTPSSNATNALTNFALNCTTAYSTTSPPDKFSLTIDDLFEEGTYFFHANLICCSILCAYEALQLVTFGSLRSSEQQHIKEAFWDYLLHKSLFTFFILDTETYDERSLWAIWFTILGSVLLLSKLSKDRFEYLTSSPSARKWPLVKICILMTFLLTISALCCGINVTDFSTYSLFLLADSSYVLTYVISVITRFIVLALDMRPNSVLENSASISYYTDLLFSMIMLSIELLHHSHLLIVSGASMIIRGICLMKIHTSILDIRQRYRRHKHYLLILRLMESNFEIATSEDIKKFADECAICWDGMENARKLPCGHLFHSSCLRSWLEQDTSCPTCRTSFKSAQQQNQDYDLNDVTYETSESEEESMEISRTQRQPLFYFDTSRYTSSPLLSWLPTISVEGFMRATTQQQPQG